MFQQKQQKNTRIESLNYAKQKQKIGQIAKKLTLPPISPEPVSHQKIKSNPQQIMSRKKKKLPDIFYEQLTQIEQPKKQSNRSSSLSMHMQSKSPNNKSRKKQQTVLKRQKELNHKKICDQHQKQIIKYYQEAQYKHQQHKVKKFMQNQKDKNNLNRSQQPQQTTQPRRNSIANRHHYSLNDIAERNNVITPKKLKPIKINSYQNAKYFDLKQYRHYLADSRQSTYKDQLTKKQAQQITNKLSIPKCELKCSKKNCQCYLSSSTDNNYSAKSSPFIKFNYEKQFPKNRIKINVNKLEQIKNSPAHQKTRELLQNNTSLRKKLDDRKGLLKRRKLKPLNDQRLDMINRRQNTEPNIISREDYYNQVFESDLHESKVTSQADSDSFIKGIVSSSKTTIEKDKLTLKRSHLKTVQIQIQTEDILMGQSDEEENYLNGKYKKSNKIQNIQPLVQLPKKVSNQFKTIKQQQSQSTSHKYQTIRSDKLSISQNNSKKLNNSHRSIEKLKGSQLSLQKNVNYTFALYNGKQIQSKNQISNMKKSQPLVLREKSRKNSQKLIFSKQVINQKIDLTSFNNHSQDREQNQVKISKNLNLQQIQDIPINFNIKKVDNTSQLSLLASQMYQKDRYCISSKSGKKSVNMFNRSPKSLLSSRVKKFFRIPKQDEVVPFVRDYKTINPQIDVKKLHLKQNFKVIHALTKLYFGETIGESIKHGVGIEVSLTQIFQGQYEDDRRKKGFLKTHEGVYEGTFLNNLRHGHGIFRNQNGQLFEGEWRMGTKNGHGIWKSPDGSHYQGEWHMNMQHGKGKFTHLSSTYQGQFKNWLKDGFGEEVFINGHKYTGQYRQGKPNGKGKYIWPDETYYEGDFLQGLKHGKGKWHQNSSSFYQGQFFEDQKNGRGAEYYKDGSYIQGQWQNGMVKVGDLFNSNKQLVKKIVSQNLD